MADDVDEHGCEHAWRLIGLSWNSRIYECRRCETRHLREARWVREDGLKRLLWPPLPA